MALSTFGAIMRFAIEMVGSSIGLYQAALQKAEDGALRETLQTLLREEERHYALMEQTRRENVTEMILEPITGLQQENYETEWKLSGNEKDGDLIKMVLILEEQEQKFFNDSSAKIPLPEVSRIFRKVAQKKEKNLAKLKSLPVSQSFKVSSQV